MPAMHGQRHSCRNLAGLLSTRRMASAVPMLKCGSPSGWTISGQPRCAVRVMAVASAGNLSISQSVVSMLREGWENPDTGETETLMNAPTLFQAAQRVGRTIRQIHQVEGGVLEESEVKFDVSFLLGGQIKG